MSTKFAGVAWLMLNHATSHESIVELVPSGDCGLAHLSDTELLAATRSLVGTTNQVFAALLVHLAEVEARGLHRTRACSSLYAYCIYELRFSEDSAARRASAAKLAKRFPLVIDAVASGELHLTGLLMLGPHLTLENHAEVLARAKFRTKKELAKLVRELHPLPVIPDSIAPIGLEPTTPRNPTWQEFVSSLAPPIRELPRGESPRDWANETGFAPDFGSATSRLPARARVPQPAFSRVSCFEQDRNEEERLQQESSEQQPSEHHEHEHEHEHDDTFVTTDVSGGASGSVALARVALTNETAHSQATRMNRDVDNGSVRGCLAFDVRSDTQLSPPEPNGLHVGEPPAGEFMESEERADKQTGESESREGAPEKPNSVQRWPALSPVTGAQQYQMQFCTTEEHVQLVDRAKALLARQAPGQSLGQLHLQAMRLLVAALEKQRFGAPGRPRSTASAASTLDSLQFGSHPDPAAPTPGRSEFDGAASPASELAAIAPSTSEHPATIDPRTAPAAPRSAASSAQAAATRAAASVAQADSAVNADARTAPVFANQRAVPVAEAPDARCSKDAPRQRGRYIPTAVRREVLERDGARCTYVDERGERCRATQYLELHHRHAFAQGGAHTAENLTLHCRTHNGLAAEGDFGSGHMSQYGQRSTHEPRSAQSPTGVNVIEPPPIYPRQRG